MRCAPRLGLDGLLHPADRGPFGAWHPHRSRELGLPTGSAQIQDEPAGNRLGNLGAVVVFDQCQREVDAGGDSSRGPHLLRTAHEDRVGIDPNGRKFAGEMFGKGPVRRRSVSVPTTPLRPQETRPCTR